MIDDIVYQLLIVCPIKTLSQLMQVNRFTHRICQTAYFWLNKFKYDKLILYHQPTSCHDWFIEFIKCDYATSKIKSIVHYARRHQQKPHYKLIDTIAVICNVIETLTILNYLIKTQSFDMIDQLTESIMYFNMYHRRPHIAIYLNGNGFRKIYLY
ncbi:MAG TPA: hypothetical protein VLG50_05470 [Candidatus Saccharimonadales bacterium]|nr:hypothetical protein [Candidatus Saccharimonadales bacterium]